MITLRQLIDRYGGPQCLGLSRNYEAPFLDLEVFNRNGSSAGIENFANGYVERKGKRLAIFRSVYSNGEKTIITITNF